MIISNNNILRVKQIVIFPVPRFEGAELISESLNAFVDIKNCDHLEALKTLKTVDVKLKSV